MEIKLVRIFYQSTNNFGMNEAEFVQKLIENDQDSFRLLVDKHHQHIFKVCLGFLHSKEDAEDITQEVFIEVFKSVKNFKQEAVLSTWLYRIAVNKSLNSLQKRKTKKVFTDLQQTIGLRTVFSDFSNPHKKLETKENASVLFKAITSLPENQRIAYTLAKYNDLSYNEIATIMNVSMSSVESLMHRAKKNLQKKLITYYDGKY